MIVVFRLRRILFCDIIKYLGTIVLYHMQMQRVNYTEMVDCYFEMNCHVCHDQLQIIDGRVVQWWCLQYDVCMIQLTTYCLVFLIFGSTTDASPVNSYFTNDDVIILTVAVVRSDELHRLISRRSVSITPHFYFLFLMPDVCILHTPRGSLRLRCCCGNS